MRRNSPSFYGVNMSKIFITGVAGFLGSHLADEFVKLGHSVAGVDNLFGGYEDNVSKEIDFHKGDARDYKKLEPLLKGVDVVYLCAAAPHEGLSVFSPNIVTEHTYNSTVGTLTAAVMNKVKRVVFCSSMARYGNQNTIPFTEDLPALPHDPYGIAKYASELVVKNICEAHGNMEYVIAVPHNIIGPRQKYDDPYRNVASIMINLMLQGRQPIIYGDGEQKRAFSFVSDVVGCLVEMAFEPQVVGQIINVGPDEEYITVNDLAGRIAKLLDFKALNPFYVNSRPMEVKYATCSADKSRRLLGYKTSHTIEQGLRAMIDWIKQRGTQPFTYHVPLEIISERTPDTWKDRLF